MTGTSNYYDDCGMSKSKVTKGKGRGGEDRIGIKISGDGGRGKGWEGDEHEINHE